VVVSELLGYRYIICGTVLQTNSTNSKNHDGKMLQKLRYVQVCEPVLHLRAQLLSHIVESGASAKVLRFASRFGNQMPGLERL
jgi:hypothetical protein